MLSWIDYSVPKLFNEESVVLFVAFFLMAFFVSPLSPLSRTTQERATAFYLPAIFIWWFLFQHRLMSLNPHVHHYLEPAGQFTHLLNSAICFAFGFAFSIRLVRLSNGQLRAIGLVFAILFLLLIFFGEGCRPAIQST